jgi:membrane protein GlpM
VVPIKDAGMELFLKALIGATLVILIQLLARSQNYYLAGLVPLFPTFALISHYLVGSQRETVELKSTIIFSMFSLIPYFIYLLALYLLVDHFRLELALLAAAACWCLAAGLLILLWSHF